jgi:TolA-binding protein
MKRKSLNKCAILFAAACLLCLAPRLYASQKDIIDSARAHIRAGEYYNAITETMRYQHLYPAGLYHPESLLIMAEAYYRGGNIFESAGIMSQCYNKYRNKPEGEKALFLLGHIRLVSGSTYFAFRTYQEYNYIYKNGAYSEAVSADTCRALALLDDFESAMSSMETHLKNYPEGEYTGNQAELRKLLDDEASRPRKKMWLSVLGSIFIPGFGHFYTEKYLYTTE